MEKPFPTCPCCGCDDPQGAATHAIVAALVGDDLDRAITLGLLGEAICASCDPACTARLQSARDARLRALAARERYRARQTRLQRRVEANAAKRAAPREAVAAAPALPSAAAAALARAKARAAGRETK